MDRRLKAWKKLQQPQQRKYFCITSPPIVTVILKFSWIQVLLQATADSVTYLMCFIISLPAAAGNRDGRFSPIQWKCREHSGCWEGWCLYSPSLLLFLVIFPQQKHPEGSWTGMAHLKTQYNGLMVFIKLRYDKEIPNTQ